MAGSDTIILVAGMLLAAAALTSLISFRAGVPILLVFLGVGLLAGEDGLGVTFDDARATYFIGSVALALILFDSGFQTRLQSFRLAAAPAVALATVGVVLTMVLLAPAVHWALGVSWAASFLLAAIVASTDAAAVFFLLRVGGVTISERVRSTLEIESGSNDPMAIFLASALVWVASAGSLAGAVIDPMDLGSLVARQAVVGLLGGALGGLGVVLVLRKLPLAPELHPITALALALVVFAGTNMLGGSGFLAVYVAGLVAGNARLPSRAGVVRFQSGLTWLAQMVMFVTLGLFATPSQFPSLILPALGVAAGLILFARPLAVWLILLPFGFTRNEVAFMAWVGLRGAVSILLALLPVMGELPEGRTLFNVAFLVVLVSLLVQGASIPMVARWLGVRVPARHGPVERVELEIPKLPTYELVSYLIPEGSPVAAGQKLPRWARPTLVLRERAVYPAHAVGALRAGDQVYLLVPRARIGLLDRLFAARRPLSDDDHDFFGDFVLDPTTTVGEVAALYGVQTPEADRTLTLAALFERAFRANFAVGDRLALGGTELIVREVDEENDAILAVGLALEPTSVNRPRLPLFQRPRELLALARAFARRHRRLRP